jgi:glycine/D-amino acid oxidase-like deaminating enzyme/nitrite reductase/ring-hydroxylating ferredoxin subunit
MNKSGNDFSNVESGSVTSGENISWWTDSSKPIEFEPLQKAIHTDVLVIGGGIAGLTTAYLLVQKNINVVLVEDGLIGSGESGRTTAHITQALDDRYFNIEKMYGEEGIRKAAESHTAAINWIAETVKKENIKCDFKQVDGYLFLHPSDKKENLEKELEATQKAGLLTKWLDNTPGMPEKNNPCIVFPDQGQFHIMKYLSGLASAIVEKGGKIFTHTHAVSINEKGATCNGHAVTANHIVVATNTPVNDFVTMHTKQVPFRTYVIAAKVPKSTFASSLWWDTGDQDSKWFTAPYHYVRTSPFDADHDLLIAGGEDHKTGQADEEHIPEEERYDALVAWTKKYFPQAGEIVYRWSGQVMEPFDKMGFIGKNPGNKNVYIITGDSGNGMTHGTLGGIIISDMIRDVANPWTEFYSPKRIPLKESGKYISELFNNMSQFADYITRADIDGLEELKTGDGAILGKGLKRYAVYKNEDNKVNIFTAVCPHMGCVVQWNAEERSFDCPCHGSRFTHEGVVINGPAINNLERVELKK